MAIVRGKVQKRPANSSEGPFVLTGEQWLALDATTRAGFVERAFRYWRRKGFPNFALSHEQILWELDALYRVGVRQVFHGREVFGNNAAVNFASSFHPQMWSVRVSRYLSPMNVFLDDGLLRSAIERSLTVWPDRQGASAASMRKILKTFSSSAAVSNFKPSVARRS